jgi:hypothetical protein
MNPISFLAFARFVHSFRAKEFKTSLRFYEVIGFEAYRLGDTLPNSASERTLFFSRAAM